MGIPLPELIPEHGNRTKRVPPRLPETPQGIKNPHHSQKNPVVKDEAREPHVRGGDVEVVRAMISEREWLEGLGLPKPIPAHPLEKKRNVGIQKEWCMSRFTRSVGADVTGMREDQEPDTQRPVRSLNWCRITIDWMLRHVLDYDQYKEPEFTFERDQTFEDIYGYLRDRMRACLQDMKRQSGSFTSRAAQECREIALRFAILSDEFLCFTNSEAKNRKQTIDRIFEAVSALKDMYSKTERHFEANPTDDRTNPLMWMSPFQAEMFSYFLILSCSSLVSSMDNYQRVPERLRNHPRIIFANLACRAVLTQNFALFMRLLKAADVLTACCIGVVAATVRQGLCRIRQKIKMLCEVGLGAKEDRKRRHYIDGGGDVSN
uniref:SAC3/GANP/THP3 conserved domain-containing protein n=1 Tax=Chromera velia CCMP2878 TaxID=1169474 RepID=A0A0G4H5B5_9ALVE|eukprot:Cvel_24745.t1-p1 / transcript=Cvel_24745.t1 / gene=Cvel_24745 / organism=Chromera_velia_CCMP2878 / gene_product=hypothetical protein / transcript_product=hypothetical protein / location=Cvel_scaffold2718:5698-10591(+) / protein_length=375 / sequence_SO=supercontig / SO=protein_coding / is_pseudo=false